MNHGIIEASCFFLVLWFIVVDGYTQEECPLWTTPKDGCCKCGNNLREMVDCVDDKGALTLTNCFCMTVGENRSLPLVGPCHFTCLVMKHSYHKINTNSTEDLNNKTCGQYKRTGLMCSKCIEGYGLPVYSYNVSCVECSDYKYNWLKYIAVAYIPLTVFYFIVIKFRISANSGVLLGYVTISQIMTIREFASWVLLNTEQNYEASFFAKLIITVISVWNLDFFLSFYPPFCLYPQLSTLHIIVLDYFIALYPLTLIVLTYSLVKLHDRFALIVWLCRPLYRCFRRFKKEWDVKTSLVEAFATFYLLSYIKILNVTAGILTPMFPITMEGKHEKILFHYEQSYPYFGEKHWPYAVFAIVFSLLFNICPLLLLCLYPCHCFHRCLNRAGLRWHTLHVFMDAILGSYSHKPRERRYFGAIYLILRIVHVVIFALKYRYTYLATVSYAMIIMIILVFVLKPYKKERHNTIDIVLFSAVLHSYLAVIFYQTAIIFEPTGFSARSHSLLYSIYISASIILLYGIVVLIARILPQKFIKERMATLYSNVYFNAASTNRELEDPLPYRLEHNERNALLGSD